MRDSWSELVERRLWPVALLLVAALVAVPLVLAKKPSSDAGPGADAPPPPAAAAAAHAPGEPVVSVASGGGPAAPLRGGAKDPFRQQHVPPRASSSARGGAPTTGATTTTPSPASGGGSSGGGGGRPAQPPQKTYLYASVDVRFGPAAGPLRTIVDVPRLAPLPSAAKPVVVFLGTRRDHETAAFLVSTDVHAQGDGTCVPSTEVCQAIELRAGQVAFLDVRAADGSVTQYELDLDKVVLHETTSKAKAQSAYARVSRAGARTMRRLVRSSAVNTGATAPRLRIPFRYAAGSGVLHIAPYMSRRRAHGVRERGRSGAHGARGDERAVADPRRAAAP